MEVDLNTSTVVKTFELDQNIANDTKNHEQSEATTPDIAMFVRFFAFIICGLIDLYCESFFSKPQYIQFF